MNITQVMALFEIYTIYVHLHHIVSFDIHITIYYQRLSFNKTIYFETCQHKNPRKDYQKFTRVLLTKHFVKLTQLKGCRLSTLLRLSE